MTDEARKIALQNVLGPLIEEIEREQRAKSTISRWLDWYRDLAILKGQSPPDRERRPHSESDWSSLIESTIDDLKEAGFPEEAGQLSTFRQKIERTAYDWDASFDIESLGEWVISVLGKIGEKPPTGTHTEPATVTTTEGETPALSQRKYLFLQTMLIMNAATADTRQTTEAIVRQAEGKAADPVQFKRDVAQLKEGGFIDTKGGQGGGCWLTAKGLNLAKVLQARI